MLALSYFFFESLALLIVIIQYKRLKETIYKYFLPYLILIVIYEYGNIYNWFFINHSNLWITNLSETACFLFYTFFLKNLIRSKKLHKIIYVLILCSLLFSALNMAFLQGFLKLDTITMLFQYSIIIFIVCMYFYELMNSIDISVSLIALPGFWLNTGLLFYYLCQFLLFSSFAYMAYKNSYNYLMLFNVVANIANVILYSCLTICFLCFRRTNKLLQSL